MQTEPIDTATSPPALAPLQLSSELRLDPLPLPTIVQPPQPPELVIDRPPAIPTALLGAPALAVARPAAQQQEAPLAPVPPVAQPAPQQPEPPVISALPLRVVTAPPQPVARTRSSR
jgi:hypothetical protein